MTSKLGVVYGQEFLRYDFGEEHPLTQWRVKLAVELMQALGLFHSPDVTIVPPPAATVEDALLFHDAAYLDFVTQASAAGSGWLDEMQDTPAFPGALEASLYIVGASVHAVDLVVDGEADHAFNPGGGLHHAHPGRASGFCILNDAAIAISHLKRRGFQRIMYLDIDAHQGDGVMYGFYEDGTVLDVDFHEDGKYLFPGTGHLLELGEGAGENHKVNIPLAPYTGDSSFMYAFRELVPPLVQAYRPEIIIMQCGVDAHSGDPLTHMRLSVNSYITAVAQVHELAHEVADGRLVLLGGGGYDPASVAIGWTRIAYTAAQIIPPPTIPEAWREAFSQITGQQAPYSLVEESTDDRNFHGTWEKIQFLKRRLGLE